MLKNFFSNILVIFIFYINFGYVYLILFLNKIILLKIINILAKYKMTYLFSINFFHSSLLLFLNQIILIILWINSILNLKKMQILHIFSKFLYFLLIVFTYFSTLTSLFFEYCLHINFYLPYENKLLIFIYLIKSSLTLIKYKKCPALILDLA